LSQVEGEYGNLRAALEWLLAQRAVEQALRFGNALWQFWWLRSTFAEARTLLEAILALPVSPGCEAARAELLSKLAEVVRLQADYTAARAYHEESLAIGRSLGDQRRVAIQIRELGRLAANGGDTERARTLLAEALAAHRRLGDRPDIVLALTFLGIVDFLEG